MKRRPALAFQPLLGLLAFGLVVLLVLPLYGLVSTTSPGDLAAGLTHPLARQALLLSLTTGATALALSVLLGTPLAWLMSRSSGGFVRALELAVQLPVVLPPAVAGLGLLLAFGRRGALGSWLEACGVSVAFTTLAVVLAQLFVSAPLFVGAALAAFRRVDENLLIIGRTLGASPARVFFRIALPLAAPGLASGAALSFARALGEFGATLMFAGSIAGRTQTLPLAIYAGMETDLRAAQALSLLLVMVAIAILFVVRMTTRGRA